MRPKYVLAVLAAAAGLACGSELRRGGAFGDARCAGEWERTGRTNVNFEVRLPAGEHEGMTVTAWMRLKGVTSNSWMTTDARYCPEAMQRVQPDLAGEAWGCTGGVTLAGSVAVPGWTWRGYAPGSVGSNAWPRGVYSVAGWASNAVTVSLGGNELTLGPGRFDRTMLPGPSEGAVLSGTGAAGVGICLTPYHEYWDELDGVVVEESQQLAAESIVTNELSFCVWRIRLDDGLHVYRSDLTRIDRSVCLGQVKTNALPRSARRLSGSGYYRFGLNGLKKPGAYDVEWFDVRIFPWWLEDEDVCRVHGNGAEEIGRRGIPRWK